MTWWYIVQVVLNYFEKRRLKVGRPMRIMAMFNYYSYVLQLSLASARSSSHHVVVLYPVRRKSKAEPSLCGKTPSSRKAWVSCSLNSPKAGRSGDPNNLRYDPVPVSNSV